MSSSADQSFLSTFCALRRLNASTNVPTPPRVELQPSPYDLGFTQNQLNMRRKYEILQYYPSNQSTQTNNLTKKQIYAQAVQGRSPYQRYTASVVAQLEICPVPQVPTTASNVPGPSVLLYLDNTVPLYNYISVKDPTSQTTNPTVSEFSFSGNTD